MILHGYFRSSATWRLRIALNLKGVATQQHFHHLRRAEQRDPDYLRLNPQGLVPTLQLADGTALTQSLAIIEWLDETTPEPPLLPADPVSRARVRAFALALVADTHPLQNLRVLAALRALKLTEDAVAGWSRDINAAGLAACESLLANTDGPFCFGDTPMMADLCLVPQLGNARRFGVDLAPFPRLLEAEAACAGLAAFADARPERQADAEQPA